MQTRTEHPYVAVNPKICGGSPVVTGTRVRVVDIAVEYEQCDIIKLFMQNPEFRAAWKNYHYYGSITDNHHYLFKVYEINNASKK